MTMIEQSTRHYSHWIGEVQNPGILVGEPGDPFRDLQDHRHGTQCLGESAGAGCLLANTATLQWKGLIHQTRRLAADPELDENHCSLSHRPVEVSCEGDGAGMSIFSEDSLRDSANQAEPLFGG